MLTHKHIEKICCAVLTICIAITILFMNSDKLNIKPYDRSLKYEDTLFDTSKVHSIDIIIDDFDDFIENATNKEYSSCDLIIDDKKISNVAIRAKGNSSLKMVSSSDSDRYSFKIEFDHYDDNNKYYGLDKLCLNNIIQDNTYMKDYLAYNLMREFGVSSPLCSYVDVKVNGESFGLYLAVEALEESFLQRNYGKNYGDLYKPETEENMMGPNMDNVPQNNNKQNNMDGMNRPNKNNQMMHSNIEGSALEYINDEYESYSYIFDNAVTKISKADKDNIISSLKNITDNKDLENHIDIDEVLRYFVVHNFLLNFDSYTGDIMHNYYLYEHDGKLSMLPWDYNLSFNSFRSNFDTTTLVNFPIDTPVSSGTIESRPMLSWIFANQEYTERYHTLFSEYITNVFDSGKFNNMIDNATSLISSYVKNDPSKFCTYEQYTTAIDTLKEFCSLRITSIKEQLQGNIGSTTDEQKNSNNLIDASHINVDNMGSTRTNMDKPIEGNNLPHNPNMNVNPSQDKNIQNNKGQEGIQNQENIPMGPPKNDNMKVPPNKDNMGQRPNGDMQRPNMVDKTQINNTTIDLSTIAQIILSIVTLSIGMVIAFFFKRRKI